MNHAPNRLLTPEIRAQRKICSEMSRYNKELKSNGKVPLKYDSLGRVRIEPIKGMAIILAPKQRRIDSLKRSIVINGGKVVNAFPRGLEAYGIERV